MTALSEDSILAILDQYFPGTGQGLLVGRGDDCAILSASGPLAMTSDIFAENSHFRQRYFSAQDIGYKALAVNLSDLAAAGAKPLAFNLCLTLTGQEDEVWLHNLAQGMSSLAAQCQITLAGGDLAKADNLNLAITAWGEVDSALCRALLRGQARPGDIIFVLGELGLARTGLCLLENTNCENDIRNAKATFPQACAAHLRPIPKLEQGLQIAAFAKQAQAQNPQDRFALMDLSDGLARDLPRLLAKAQTGLGARLDLREAMLPWEMLEYCRVQAIDPYWFAWQGGEDYALLGTCPARLFERLADRLGPQLQAIGQVTAGPDLTLNGAIQDQSGFDHFAGP